MNKIAVLIPAYEPDEKLLQLVKELKLLSLQIVVVDDGSTDNSLFIKISQWGVVVLTHDKNCGKGRAIKTGIKYLTENDFNTVVTADADGQHSAADIFKMVAAASENQGSLILGVRDTAKMPSRSKIGNNLTKLLFSIMYGIKITDTQTGLRAIPLNENTAQLISLEGERYEYEMNILVYSSQLFTDIIELPIDTIYIEENASSHFRPIVDGVKIYSLLFKKLPRFLISSIVSFAVDYSLFNILFYMAGLSSVGGTIVARLVSASINFTINKNLVFKTAGRAYTLVRYATLAAGILLANCILIYLLVNIAGVPAYIAKIIVEMLLYILSFTMQNRAAHK